MCNVKNEKQTKQPASQIDRIDRPTSSVTLSNRIWTFDRKSVTERKIKNEKMKIPHTQTKSDTYV